MLIVLMGVYNQTSLNSEFEQQLVEACKGGDRTAQHTLYNRYSKAMYNTCLRMLKVPADSEDVLQNAFVEVFLKLDSFRFESTVGAWIKRIVVNACINHLKKRKMIMADWDERIPEPHETSVDEADQAYEVSRVRRAVEGLPDGYRTVLSLYLFEGYDHSEIGEILEISEATSKSQYSRARKRVREMLDEMH
jgi:RNA polymerase sigma-70 factor (ECF subfamily)